MLSTGPSHETQNRSVAVVRGALKAETDQRVLARSDKVHGQARRREPRWVCKPLEGCAQGSVRGRCEAEPARDISISRGLGYDQHLQLSTMRVCGLRSIASDFHADCMIKARVWLICGMSR